MLRVSSLLWTPFSVFVVAVTEWWFFVLDTAFLAAIDALDDVADVDDDDDDVVVDVDDDDVVVICAAGLRG